MFHRVKSDNEDNTPQEESKTIEATKSDNTQPPIEDSKDMTTNTQDDKTQDENTQASTPASFSYQQRPAQPAPSNRMATSYPGSAPSYTAGGSNYSIPSHENNAQSGSNMDRRLTIGSGITMSGEIESCDYLLVEGTVEAALKGANFLEIAESGVFYGTVEIGEANIAGRFEGDITVHGRLTISASGTVTGSIVYKELELEAGAIIDGKLTPLAAVTSSNTAATPTAAPRKAAKPKQQAAAPTKAKTKPTEAPQQEPANSDGGLFSKVAAE